MKKSILDLGNDVTLREIMKFKSIKQLERVNFIEDSLDNESLIIANLSSGCKNILLIGLESLKIPLLCIMNCPSNSKVNLLTNNDKILNLFYQYNDQNNQISLREDMTSEDIYFDVINSSNTYKDVLDVDDLNYKKINKYLKTDFDCSIINLDFSYSNEICVEDLIKEENILNNICLIKTSNKDKLKLDKNFSLNNIKETTLYLIKKFN
tara:strand:+ start:220 stop:846 length:627 start_codon:yes stop_codon:yes gene_type:complete